MMLSFFFVKVSSARPYPMRERRQCLRFIGAPAANRPMAAASLSNSLRRAPGSKKRCCMKFTGGSDGAGPPSPLIADSAGSLIGAAAAGGHEAFGSPP